jgi:GT2 family glycosyltransferase
VAGVVAAYKRPAMLRTLLDSMKEAGRLSKMIVVDNGFDAQTEAICREQPFPVLYHRPDRNLGCGGGVGRGLTLGLQDPDITHLCCFDDDAHATPGAVEALIRGMIAVEADVAVPLVVNAEGYIGWTPGLQEGQASRTLRRSRLRPAEYRAACGLGAVPFSWAPWPVVALSARVVRECGIPRDDFWLCAEDLEFTLRLTYRHRGVLVPAAVCRHLPPPSSGGDDVESPHYLRFCLMLQNASYIATRLPHARRILRNLPGNYWRFLRTFGCNAATVRDVWAAWWRGAMRGKPAGIPGADGFKQRFLSLGGGQRQTENKSRAQ